MPEFPDTMLPDFGANFDLLLDAARDLVDLVNTDSFLWAMAAISLAITVLFYLINKLVHPPELDT